MADVDINEVAQEEWDLIALPGGMPGTHNRHDTMVFRITLPYHSN